MCRYSFIHMQGCTHMCNPHPCHCCCHHLSSLLPFASFKKGRGGKEGEVGRGRGSREGGLEHLLDLGDLSFHIPSPIVPLSFSNSGARQGGGGEGKCGGSSGGSFCPCSGGSAATPAGLAKHGRQAWGTTTTTPTKLPPVHDRRQLIHWASSTSQPSSNVCPNNV